VAADLDYDLPGGWTGHLKTGLTYVATIRADKRRHRAGDHQLNSIGPAGLRSDDFATADR
jgi:hypothetical protein